MKWPSITDNSSIQHRLLLVTLVPLLVVTLLLTYYTVKVRQTDAFNELYNSGRDAADYFATAAEFPLYSGNLEALSELTISINEVGYVSGAIVLNVDLEEVAVSGEFLPPSIPLSKLPEDQALIEDSIYFKRPVFLSGVSYLDYIDNAPENIAVNAPIGWVLLALDQSPIHKKNRKILIASLSLSAIGFFTAILLSYYLWRTITRPISSLTSTVRELEKGNLSARASSNTQDELAVLANGINQLAQTVADNRKNLQQQIKEATGELENTLEDLRNKNRELDASREHAEMANQAKSEFLARMSHELRTPITAIQGFIHLLYEVAANDSDRHYCKIIDQAASQLLVLIDDILVFSKLQSNAAELETHPFDLRECVEGVASLFATAAQDKGLDLLVDFDPNLDFSRLGDSHRIGQIINNLVSNAIKFTSNGFVSISVSADGNNSEIVDILVRDTGIGIKSDKLSQVFNAFTQADTSISRRFGGTGLGLTIVKNLAELMKGSIGVSSQRGKGTTFHITLPLEKQSEQKRWGPLSKKVAVYATDEVKTRSVCHALQLFSCTADAFHNESSIPTTGYDITVIYLSPSCFASRDFPSNILQFREKTATPLILLTPVISLSQLFTPEELKKLQPATFIAHPAPLFTLYNALTQKSASPPTTVTRSQELELLPLKGLNILVAEDNEFTGLLLETLISKSGGHCTVATNGTESVKASLQEKYDVMLFDVHMPGLSGVEATRQIRQGSGINAKTPIIALTADIVQQEEEELRQAGANDLLFKPLNENFLLERIRKAAGITTGIRTNVEITADDISTDMFYDEINRLLSTIRQAFKNKDHEQMTDIAHQLAGVAGVFKLESLDEKSRALHSSIKGGNDDEILLRLGMVEAEVKILSRQPV